MLLEAALLARMIAAAQSAAPTVDCAPPAAQEAQQRAGEQYRDGALALSEARFGDARALLARAVELDPAMALGHYGLGEAQMGLKSYPDAVRSFRASREAFRCEAALPPRERERLAKRLEDEIREVRDAIRALDRRRLQESAVAWKEVNADTATSQEKLRALQGLEQRLLDLERLRAGRDRAPIGVTLALGTALFQAGSLEDAEREFRAVLAADPRSGDAHNNLAVVCMLDGRLAEAEREMALALKAGVPVNPRLKQEIERRKRQQGRQ